VVPGNVNQEPDSVAMSAVKLLRRKTDRSFFDEFDLATLELEAGALEAARARFETLSQSGRMPYRYTMQASDPFFYLGRIAALQGDRDAALSYLERALENRPGDPFVLAELVVLGGGSEPRERLERYYSKLDAQLLLGEAFLVHGRGSEAGRELRSVAISLPTLHRVLVPLAVAHGVSGNFDAGVAVYRHSLALRSIPVIWSAGVSDLLRGWAREHESDRTVQLEAARLLYFHGRFREALSMLLRLGDSGDDDDAVQDLIGKIRESISQVPRDRGYLGG
jgi:tetratricopeptide (TPR) repeat protein